MMFVTARLAIVGGYVPISVHNHSGPARRNYSTGSSSFLSTCGGQVSDLCIIIGCQLFQEAVEVVSWVCQEVTRLWFIMSLLPQHNTFPCRHCQ